VPLENTRAFVIKRELDARRRIRSMAYFDHTGKPATNREGIHQLRFELDDSGGRVVRSFFGPSGQPIRNSTGVHAVLRKLDKRGDALRETFLGPMGRNTISTEGFHELAFERDAVGNATRVRFFGRDGKPVVATPPGAASMAITYNGQGKAIARMAYDLSGAPMLDVKGNAGERVTYDDAGRPRETVFVDIEGRPHANSEGVAGLRITYDDLGQIAKIESLGENGKPAKGATGIALTRDARGNVVVRTYLDDGGLPRTAPYTSVETIYNEFDEPLRIRFVNAEGKLVNVPGLGYAEIVALGGKGATMGVRQFFDASGRRVTPKATPQATPERPLPVSPPR